MGRRVGAAWRERLTPRPIFPSRPKCARSPTASSRDVREDLSGAAVAERLEIAGYEIVERRVVPDGVESVAAVIAELADGFAGLIVTTGGHRVRAAGPDAGGHLAGARPSRTRPCRGDAACEPARPPVPSGRRHARQVARGQPARVHDRVRSSASRPFSMWFPTPWHC